MLISAPLRKQLFVLEWKSIDISSIKIGSKSLLATERASVLRDVPSSRKVSNLKFEFWKGDIRERMTRGSMTIKKWILTGLKGVKEPSPRQQLCEYAQSPEIERWKKDGYTITPILVVVVGSRHILLSNLEGDKFNSSPRLALE